MSKRLEAKRLNEVMYEKVVERFWRSDESARGEPCGILLVRCSQSFEETTREIRARLEAELERPVEAVVDDNGREAAFLLFGVAWSRTHYLALRVKQELIRLVPGEFALMIAEAGEHAERNPRAFEKMADLFAQLPEAPEIVIFQEHVQPGGTQSVLLVDGDEEMRRYLELRFRLKGYRVLAAENGPQGLDLFRKMKPDVVVTDLNLTGMDGFHLLTRLHREDPNASSKIVVFTDNRVEESISKCFELGVADYITRPFSPVELEERIERLLQ